MSKSTRPRTSRATPARLSAYWVTSKRPLQILAFLLPLVVAYEICLALVLRSERGVQTVTAHKTFLQFFAAFGVAPAHGLYIGGLVLVVVLLIWHLLNRDPTRIDGRALWQMALESMALTLPLLALSQLITRAAPPAALLAFQAPGAGSVSHLDLWSKLAISVGAGLYEELLFRMMLIALLHTILVDMGRASNNLGATIAVVVSAALFTWYHPLGDSQGRLSLQKVAFFFVAGLYFGAVYVVRGFGIVVAVHALYDIITVTLLSGDLEG